MARLDARVKTELPARAIWGPEVEEGVSLREISLGGALVHGLQDVGLDEIALRIRADLPGHGEVELKGQVVRREDGLAAMRFFAADEPSVSALWGHIQQRLKPAGVCPYCARQIAGPGGLCDHCRMCLDFEDRSYLERHLKNTFAARISGLVSELDAAQLQTLVGFIEAEVSHGLRPEAEVDLIGQSPAMAKVIALVVRLASSDSNVLILGEQGTEKEWVARALHKKSERRLRPFVMVKVNTIPVGLIDPELFGFNRGAFMQADRAHKGLLEGADGGSVFIDDVGALPPSIQAKLLGFLKDGIVERVGARGGKRVDVRILAGAEEEFAGGEAKGGFVEKLLKNMGPEALHLPPLRHRGEDRVLLAEHFLRELACQANKSAKGFSEDALRMIRNYAWPGNVEQLKDSVKRAVAAARGKCVKKTDMALGETPDQINQLSLRAAVSVCEKEAVERALEENRYNISKAAKSLEISRPSLYALMKKHDVQKPDL